MSRCRSYSALHLLLCLIILPMSKGSTSSTSLTAGTLSSSIPSATGSSAISVPGPWNTSSQWTVSVSVSFSVEFSSFNTSLFLSAPFDTGPSAASANGTYWDVCVLWLSDIIPESFTGVDASAAGSGNCSALLGSQCYTDIARYVFQLGLNGCGGLQETIRSPATCQSIRGSKDPNITGIGTLNPPNDTAFSTYLQQTNSSDASEVFDIATHQIWPILVIEEQKQPGNLTGYTANMACLQALNLTGSQTTDGSGSSAIGTGPATSTGTSTAAGSPTSTGKSHAERGPRTSWGMVCGGIDFWGTTLIGA